MNLHLRGTKKTEEGEKGDLSYALRMQSRKAVPSPPEKCVTVLMVTQGRGKRPPLLLCHLFSCWKKKSHCNRKFSTAIGTVKSKSKQRGGNAGEQLRCFPYSALDSEVLAPSKIRQAGCRIITSKNQQRTSEKLDGQSICVLTPKRRQILQTGDAGASFKDFSRVRQRGDSAGAPAKEKGPDGGSSKLTKSGTPAQATVFSMW